MDVKAGNCIFNGEEPELSALIDFDLSRPLESVLYPRNYSIDVSDGMRHQDAKPGGHGHYEHDTFALAAVLKRSKPVNEESQSQWDAVCLHVASGLLAEATAELLNQEEYELTLIHAHVGQTSATGSPKK